MARKTTTAITKSEPDEAAALAELSDFFDGVTVDGMDDVGGEDLSLAVKVFNCRGKDKNGDALRKNTFLDTISEETQDTIGAVLLVTQKSNRWDSFDNATDKTIVHCASADRITGTLESGEQRPCANCPDRGWFKDADGNPIRKCGEVHTVVGIERLTQKAFLIRFKKTGLKPWRRYLMANHWNVRTTVKKDSKGETVTDDKGNAIKVRANVPLFAYEATIGLELSDNGNYAIPTIARGEILPAAEMREAHENAKAYLEIMGAVLEHADTQDAKHATTERDPGLASDDFADDFADD